MIVADLLDIHSDALSVSVSPMGARLVSVRFEGAELLYGPKTPEQIAADSSYCGAVCGRVANRIAGGHCVIGGRAYQLPINNGANHLHGGLSGFSDKNWAVLAHDASRIHLRYFSADGEEGYPGNLEVQAIYELVGDTLSLVLEARSDADTLCNLTQHAYWNLSSEADVSNHELRVQASEHTPIVANIPTGEIAHLAGSAYDLREWTRLGLRLGSAELPLGYDDNYCMQSGALVELRASGRRLVQRSDAPGLQVYTGYYLPDCYGGVALEPQAWPDAPNNAHFPSIELAAGAPYRRVMSWQFLNELGGSL